jgi:hypothetical protein
MGAELFRQRPNCFVDVAEKFSNKLATLCSKKRQPQSTLPNASRSELNFAINLVTELFFFRSTNMFFVVHDHIH